MSKIAYDMTDVEDSGGDFDTPVPVGVYKAKLEELTEGESSKGNDMLTATYVLVSGEYKGRKLWDYIVLMDSTQWKFKQFLKAMGLISENGKQKGELDTNKVVGKIVQIRVKHEVDNRPELDEPVTRAKVGMVLAAPDDEDDDDLSDEATDDDDAGEEEDLTRADLEEYDMDELKELIDEYDLDVRVTKRSKVAVIRERVADGLELPEEEEEDDDDDELSEDYNEWDPADLKAELKERGLSAAGSKKTLVKKLQKDDESDDGSEPF